MNEQSKIGVLGAGMMGAEIALCLCRVRLSGDDEGNQPGVG
jgi:3-hydroxyacyl-CoA dehydrogenase